MQSVRDLLQLVLVCIFLILPWLRMNGQPVILFDIFNRNFILFGFTFHSHDMPLLFFIIILVILSIFLITALFGRLWCGWACPQTVFLHSVFNKIEYFILGNFVTRNKLFKSEESFLKKIKVLAVYLIFLLVCWMLAHSFVAYFLGSDAVTGYVLDGPENHLNSFYVLMAMTAALFVNFAFFREKLCFFVCPYGRFQNALIDRNSLTVFYDLKRGEKRGKFSANKPDSQGDCIDCNRCVNVCPTKIDIRNGFQLECIACGKCIDACNEVMLKINRKPDLICYETVNQKPITLKRFRLGLYAALLLLFFGALVLNVSQRALVDLTISRSPTQPFSVRLQDSKKILQNQIRLHFKNQSTLPVRIKLSLSEENLKHGFQIVSPANGMMLMPGKDYKTFGFIEIDSSRFSSEIGQARIIFRTGNSVVERDFQFIEVK